MKKCILSHTIKWWYFLWLLLLVTACNTQKKQALLSLKKAGKNAAELQKVLDYYQQSGETQKYKAACFLMASMPGKEALYYKKMDIYTHELTIVTHTKGLTRKQKDKLLKRKNDSVRYFNGAPTANDFYKKSDLHTIKAEFLIKNINLAFKAWQQPWAKHVSFADFCEYILPYRIHNEPLSNWREQYYNQFISFADSVNDPSDPKQMVEAISNYLYKRWVHLDNCNLYGCYPSVLEVDKMNGGLCDHRYFLITAIMRSIGLPVAIDGTLQWTNYTGGHSWNVLLDTNGEMRPFNGGEDNFRFYDKNVVPMWDGGSICTKVYRSTYAYQETSFTENFNVASVNAFFNNRCLIDVTDNYDIPKTKLVIDIDDDKLEEKPVYLCVFNYGQGINTIAWAKVKNGKADFGYVGLPAFYIPVYYSYGKPSMINKPLVMYKEEEKRYEYNPSLSSTRKVRLYRKFNFSGEFLAFADELLGCKIQGANSLDFKDACDIYSIQNKAKGCENEVFENEKSYQYIRLLSKDSSQLNIAELEFWAKNKTTGQLIKLSGKPIGGNATEGEDNNFANAFDGSVRTNFIGEENSWIGLDLGQNSDNFVVTQIRFIPRNNYNVIEKGHIYELFYLGNNGWASLGKKKANDYYLDYDNVPSGVLLLLKNHTEGVQERIFMYNDDLQEQVWW